MQMIVYFTKYQYTWISFSFIGWIKSRFSRDYKQHFFLQRILTTLKESFPITFYIVVYKNILLHN